MSSLSNGTGSIYYDDQLWISIEDLPIWNWNKIVETGSLIYLFREYKKQEVSEDVVKVWDSLQQQHADEFGIDISLQTRIRTMRKVIGLNVKFLETGDRSLLNLIRVETKRIEDAGSYGKSQFYKVLNYVSKYMGFQIKPKEFSVKEWYHALRAIEADAQRQQDGKGNTRK